MTDTAIQQLQTLERAHQEAVKARRAVDERERTARQAVLTAEDELSHMMRKEMAGETWRGPR